MVPHLPRRPLLRLPLPAHWWQPGVYGSVPAVALWIAARLPADLLWALAGVPDTGAWLNQAGDAVFVAGWTASALLLWLGRGRSAPVATRTEAAEAVEATVRSTPRRRPAG